MPSRHPLHSAHAVALAIGIVVAGCSSASDTAPVAHPPIVESVVDGDTIRVRFGDRVEIVRLLGIDTPESVDPNRPEQCFGAEATGRLSDLLPTGSVVRIERDVEGRDQYGRLLGYVFAAEAGFVNERLLAEGFADLSIIGANRSYSGPLTNAYTAARTSERGLWRTCGGPDVPLDPAR
ncbi:MAG: thermonuclease family protein [Acidimicrobiales bacterium]